MGEAVEKARPAEVAPVSETAAVLQVIERLVLDPNVDPAKFEKLCDLQERVLARNAEAAFNTALAIMQPLLPEVEQKGLNDHTHKHYAKWEDIHQAVTPILTAHGFALTFRTGEANGKVTVTAILRHKGGYKDETTISLPADTGAGRNAVQAVGSSLSYGKRYTACALLNIRTRGEDDDGKAATKRSGTKVAGAMTATSIGRQIKADMEAGDEPGMEMADPTKDPLYNDLIADLHFNCSTRDEAEQWLKTKKREKDRGQYGNKHSSWRKKFYEDEFLPFLADMPEVASA